MSLQTNIMPAIYVGTYNKYNFGSIGGSWLSLDKFIDKKEFLAACKVLHKDEANPELMFQDWDGIPELFIGESWIDELFWEFMRASGDHEAKTAFISYYGSWDADKFEESCQGIYESELKFTYQLVEDIGMLCDVPEPISQYFDYKAFNRDLFISDYTLIDGFVFRADI